MSTRFDDRRATRCAATRMASSVARSGGVGRRSRLLYMAAASQQVGSTSKGQVSTRTVLISWDSTSEGMAEACTSDDLPAPEGPNTVTQRLERMLLSRR